MLFYSSDLGSPVCPNIYKNIPLPIVLTFFLSIFLYCNLCNLWEYICILKRSPVHFISTSGINIFSKKNILLHIIHFYSSLHALQHVEIFFFFGCPVPKLKISTTKIQFWIQCSFSSSTLVECDEKRKGYSFFYSK